jgi:hypothetical protein
MPDNSEPNGAMETPSDGETGAVTQMEAVKERPVLFASVIVMGVLIVIGLIVVFGTIIYRLSSSPDPATVPVRGQFGSVDVPVAEGTAVVRTTFIEDRLSIVTTNEGVLEVIIIDTKRGVELGRVRLVADEALSGSAEPPAAE